jgi:Ulp1 family protease
VTDAEALTWKQIHSKGSNAHELIINFKSYEIPRMKMWCLQDGEWLNDEAINIYMTLLQVSTEGHEAVINIYKTLLQVST